MTAPMRIPPNALEAERAVLAGLVLERDAMDVVAEILPMGDEFYSEANARIYEAMRALHGRGQPIDTTTLREELVRTARLAAVGGDEYIFSLISSLPVVENIEAHAGLVLEKARIRSLITACHELSACAYADYGDAGKFFDHAESAIFALTTMSSVKQSGPEVVDATNIVRRIQDIGEGKAPSQGMTTGIEALDRATSGMYRGDLIVVGADTGQGKSSLAMGAAWAACEEQNEPALFYSMEMQKNMCEDRLMAMVSHVDSKLIRAGRISNDDWRRIARASERINARKFLIDAEPGLNFDAIRSRSRRVASKLGRLSVIVVDYLQIMGESGAKDRSREREVAGASGAMKRLAKELDCVVILLSQMNRGVTARPDKWPEIRDLRESGAIEQDADTIWMPYRPGVYAAAMSREQSQPSKYGRAQQSSIKAGEDDGSAKVIIGKQRSGSPGVVSLMFDGPSTRFYDPNQGRRPEATFRGVPDHVGGDPEDSGDGESFQENWYP